MYVSSSPCGDARLNCPYESKAAREMTTFLMLMWLLCCHDNLSCDGFNNGPFSLIWFLSASPLTSGSFFTFKGGIHHKHLSSREK